MDTWVEVTNCTKCGVKIIRSYKPRPNGLFGNKIQCGDCGHTFVVTWAILRDEDDSGGMLEELTTKAMNPQTLLEDFLEGVQ